MQAFPRTYLVGKTGTIRYASRGYDVAALDELETGIKSELGKAFNTTGHSGRIGGGQTGLGGGLDEVEGQGSRRIAVLRISTFIGLVSECFLWHHFGELVFTAGLFALI